MAAQSVPSGSSNDDPETPAVPQPPASELNPASDLVGAILDVPDHHWGITTSAPHHPSACTHYQGVTNRGLLVKGTDAENVRA
jgi:hypothetical protein